MLDQYGQHLGEWLVPARGRALLDLIEQCPPTARWRGAAAQDDDAVRELLTEFPDQEPAPRWEPALVEYTATTHLLREAVSLLAVLARGRILKSYDPPNGPTTAFDRVSAQIERDSVDWLISVMTPHAVIDQEGAEVRD